MLKIEEIKQNVLDLSLQYLDRPIYGVYFICCMGNYLEVVEEQLKLLAQSGLYDKTKKIYCFICLYNPMDKRLHELFYHFYNKMEFFSTPLNLYEKFAINNYKSKIKDSNYYIYYFHTKGVSKSINSHWSKRRQILNFYTITKFELSLKLLQFYDVVGVTLFQHPKKHFSGNFWWSKSDNLYLLENVNNNYLAPEMYICGNPFARHVGLSKKEDVFESSNLEEHKSLTDEQIIENIYEETINNIWGIDSLHLC